MTDLPEQTVSLLDAARVVARGGDLDSKLGALASQARRVAAAEAVVVYLVDAAGERIVPVAWDGATGSASALEITTAPTAVSAALIDRQTRSLSREDVAALGGALPPTLSASSAVPLVATDQAGDTEIEGLLVVGWDSADPAGAAVSEALLAMADLAAVAIRQARLENTLNEQADWLDRVANTDGLTGLANRHAFDRMLQLELARAERQGAPVGLALFGVDGLDVVAERDGAGASDDVLRRVAATLANELRLIDTVARIGPETFAAICPGSPGQEAASRVRDALLNPVTGPDRPDLPITVTAAVAGYPEDGTDADALMEAAARLLDRARASDPGGVAERDEV
ncbi:MAG: GGDEF domain-containing protein [Chloroflexi bacterium]|nr:GGDEF domain-containing protein [Chloroflexota bacterium]